MEIPEHFENNLLRENSDKLFIAVNAINGVKAGLGGAYLNQIITSFNNDIRVKWSQQPRFSPIPQIEVTSSNWFNKFMNYRFLWYPVY